MGDYIFICFKIPYSKALSKIGLTEMSLMIGFLKKIHGAILRKKHGLFITKYLGLRQLIAIAAVKSLLLMDFKAMMLCVCVQHLYSHFQLLF